MIFLFFVFIWFTFLRHFGLGFSMCATITPGGLEAANMITSKTLMESKERDSQSHKARVNIVLNKCWQKDVHKYMLQVKCGDMTSRHFRAVRNVWLCFLL